MRPSLTRVLRKTSLRLGFERDWYLYLVAAVIGIVIAGVATMFIAPLRHVEMWGLEMHGNPNLWWIVLCAPCIGGLIVGFLRAIIKAEDVGPGITTLMYAVLRKRSRIRWRMGLQKWLGSTATIASGGSAGAEGPIITIGGQTIGFSMAANGQLIGGLKVGDNVRIDNSWQLAMQSYQRHQVPPPEDDVYAWDQYKDENGAPIYPQREVLIGPVGASNTAGRMYNGNIKGKVLVLECLMDIDALPWQADWYRSRVKASLGESFEDNFALVFIDNANHENPLWQEANARIVSYAGALQQGLRDLADWVENGVHPSDTAYEVVDTQVHLPDSASERRGIQPVVSLRANGGECADVAVGEEVRFEGVIEVPPGAGKVVSAEWDFVAIGEYSEKARIDTPSETVTVTASHSYAKPGTYFPALRTASNRQGDQDTAYARVENLARARVVVR